MYYNAIGSNTTALGYHGYIALFLYIKVSELEAGHITPTLSSIDKKATGKNLYVTTLENKGAVGLPLQIHDTSICFVTCHLPSDSKGKSKLSRRNESAHSILKEVILAAENIGFDLHLQVRPLPISYIMNGSAVILFCCQTLVLDLSVLLCVLSLFSLSLCVCSAVICSCHVMS